MPFRAIRLGFSGALAGVLVLAAWPVLAEDQAPDLEDLHPLKYQAPEFLTFDELKALSEQPYPTGSLRAKYNALWTRPIISNEAYYRGARPHRPSSPELGPYLHIVTWNIEKSLHMDQAIEAFTNPEAYVRQIDPKKARPNSARYRRMMRERQFLEQADIVLLQEMDIGVKRSGYRDAAKDLAQALNMNYTYLPMHLEIDPVLVGTEMIRFKEGPEDVEMTERYRVDPARYRGLFGQAVLSRYPIIHVEGFRLFHQAYDWYWQEKQKLSFLEGVRRFGMRGVFYEKQEREMKVGGRNFFRVDVYVPDLPEKTVSVINIHLEIKCTPEQRAVQMAEILNYIKPIGHPVILAGDFNSAPGDLSPTSTPKAIESTLESPEFYLSRAVEYVLPEALLINTARFISNVTKNYQNPTAPHIPIVAPNKTGELFSMLRAFRFADGRTFDWRGDPKRAAGKRGKLGNSNERDFWAYKSSFRTDRTVAHIIGKYRLDWIFVKGYLTHPKDPRGSYRFAPHHGRTLNALNKYLKERISDHDPSVVDLPLEEPPVRDATRGRLARGRAAGPRR